MSNIDEADFAIHTQLIVDTLKTQNQELLAEFEKLFSTLISTDYFLEVLIAAVHRISLTDVDTYQWILQAPVWIALEVEMPLEIESDRTENLFE